VNCESTRILLIEDNPGDARLIRELLAETEGGPFDVTLADCLEDGLGHLAPGAADVVLLDLLLPDSRGLDTLARVVEKAPWVPIVVLTVLDDRDLAVEAVRQGAQDYLVKGETDGNLLARSVRYALERKEAQSKLAEANTRLEKANRRLEELATTDELTGLWNRRRFLEILQHECRRAGRTGADLALAMLDLDRFKAVNDTFGHAFGDRVLAEVASVMRRAARSTDTVARYGGEEFMVLMPESSAAEALHAAERIRTQIARRPVSDGTRDVGVTASLGISALKDGGPGGPEHLIRRADAALYAAKQAGRNNTQVWSEACAATATG